MEEGEEQKKELEELRDGLTSLHFLVHRILHIGMGVAIGWLASKVGLSKLLEVAI